MLTIKISHLSCNDILTLNCQWTLVKMEESGRIVLGEKWENYKLRPDVLVSLLLVII